MTILLRGIAARAGERIEPVGPDVAFGKYISVTVDFKPADVVGLVRSLRRAQDGNVWAEAEVIERAPLASHPYFAVGIMNPVVSRSDDHPMGVTTGGFISQLAPVAANMDPDLPPYEVEPAATLGDPS